MTKVIEKIDKIYKEIANKELLPWVIKWHPVKIGDVLDRMEEIKSTIELRSSQYCAWLYDEICILWGHKRKPIEEQSEECIDYIYNLLLSEQD